MKTVNEQFAEMQKKTLENLEPMQNMNTLAAQAFERIARKNYDLMGDLVDYAVAQVKVPANPNNLQEVYEQKVAETKAFAEKVNERAKEYVALAGELGELAQSKSAESVKAVAAKSAPAKKAAASKPAAEASDKAAVASKPAAAKKTAAASKPAAAKETAAADGKEAVAKKKTAAKKTAAKAK